MPPEEDSNDDTALIRAYCTDRSEAAFRMLVERYLPAVWSTARRVVNGDAALAEDVAQEVFTRLAQRAHRLKPPVVLGGWLHRHSCFLAQNALRTATRRRARELTAATMNADSDNPWPHLAPRIDAALEVLPASDRDAVVLRFFDKRDFRSIGHALGMSEDAARMKITRALEKLRRILGKRFAVLTVAALVALLNENAVAASPAGLSAQIVKSATARAASATASGGIGAKLAAFWRRKRAIAAGVVILFAGLFFSWHLLSGSSAPPSQRKMGNIPVDTNGPAVPPEKQPVDITVRLVLVPETSAAGLFANRWGGEDDTALLDELLQRARTGPPGISVLAKLTGQCPRGGMVELGAAKPWEYPVEWSRPGDGPIVPVDFKKQDLGTVASIEASIGAEGNLCDLNLQLRCNFPDPALQKLPTSLSGAATTGVPVLTAPEFRRVEVTAQACVAPGRSCLILMTRFPETDGTEDRQMLTFVTVEPRAAP